jgi:geranylgeranyl diphosphate synthase, type II
MHSYKELVTIFEERFRASLPFSQSPTTLYEPCQYLLRLDGKRIRPVLCLMANELFNEINADAWHAAFGIELFHNFTLIHDDIMDKAPLRRGNPTIHAKYGLTAGILCGDVMSVYAYDEFAQIKHSLPLVLSVFNKAAIGVSEGQQLDMDYESRNDVQIDEYMHMITLKTSVLLACSLKLGAITGGGLGDNANKLYEFGKNLGLAFQLQDDYLDAFGDPVKSGKQNGGDIIANKKTYLLLKALENADTLQRKKIVHLLEGGGDEKVAAMLAIYTATGADVSCRQEVEKYSELAFDSFEQVAIPSKRKLPLFELARYLLMRDK